MSEKINISDYMDWKAERSSGDSRYSVATSVNVRRSDGRIESGWVVAAKSPDGKVTVIREDTGETKKVTTEELDRFNIFSGDRISVERTSGAIEDDWTLVGKDSDGRIVAEKHDKGKKLTKHISLEGFIALNYDIETDETSHY